jgi:hypothetical protein
MLVAVILSFIRWDDNPTFHAIAGVTCALLFSIHFYLNRKAFAAYSKSIKKLKTLVRLRWLTDLLLVIIWSIAVVSGFLAILPYAGIMESEISFGRFHGVFARVGGILIVIHLFQHVKQIISYVKTLR